jgi:hypothetical protein
VFHPDSYGYRPSILLRNGRWDREFADSPLEEAVMSELVSVWKFPARSEFAGNFARFGYSVALQLPEKVSDRRCLRGQFPKHPSREFLRLSREFNRAIRECCSGIRDLLSRSIICVF